MTLYERIWSKPPMTEVRLRLGTAPGVGVAEIIHESRPLLKRVELAELNEFVSRLSVALDIHDNDSMYFKYRRNLYA